MNKKQTPPPMSLDRFQDGLDLYGADFSQWPESLQASARVTAQTTDGAAQWQQAQKIYALLGDLKTADHALLPSADLMSALKAIPKQSQRPLAAGPFKRFFDDLTALISGKMVAAQATAMTAALLVGIMTAMPPAGTLPEEDQNSSTVDISESLFTDSYFDSMIDNDSLEN